MIKNKEKNLTVCLCGSGLPGVDCCQPLLSGDQLASTAEQLMRSRYVAYASGDAAYLSHTWHSSMRPELITLEKDIRWLKLQVITATKPAAAMTMNEDWVEFKASYVQQQLTGKMFAGQLHERSRFVRELGEWRYIDGVQFATEEINLNKPGRNDMCFCGSMQKFKKCCARFM